MKLLYVEDDPAARLYVATGLARLGFEVELASGLKDALGHAEDASYDALVIDIGLPDGDGFELLAAWRAMGLDTPALFLTARGEVADRLRGFDSGADDYLPKPFALAELAARARAISRRRGPGFMQRKLRAADLELDVVSRRASRGSKTLELPAKEFALLELLMLRQGSNVSRLEILERIWPRADLRSNVITVHVNSLRQKIDRGFSTKLIHTVPGVGYRLEAPPDAEQAPPDDHD
jgi:two-component system copper resistance phosphate regulon response regulator CusR